MFADPQPQHEMQLSATYPSGVEEWYCPQCGRRFLMQWKPVYSKVILEIGDEFAIHSGGRWASTAQQPPAADDQVEEEMVQEEVINEDDPVLLPYVEWMEQIGFESLWNQGW